MRSILRQLGVRGGIAAVLILMVVGAVVLARLIDGRSTTSDIPTVLAPTGLTPSGASASEADDGLDTDTPSAYPDDAAIINISTAFVTAWLKSSLSSAAWQHGLAPVSTASLLASLDNVDPTLVPATRTTGAPVITSRTATFARVSVAADSGTVVLTLTKGTKGWLVDDVDWDPL